MFFGRAPSQYSPDDPSAQISERVAERQMAVGHAAVTLATHGKRNAMN
jgi:hypothetical protein